MKAWHMFWARYHRRRMEGSHGGHAINYEISSTYRYHTDKAKHHAAAAGFIGKLHGEFCADDLKADELGMVIRGPHEFRYLTLLDMFSRNPRCAFCYQHREEHPTELWSFARKHGDMGWKPPKYRLPYMQ